MTGAPDSKRQIGKHPLLMLTQLVGSPLLNPAGERLGMVEDFIVRLADSGYPPVTGLKVRVGGRHLFVGASMLAKLAPNDIGLGEQKLDLGRFERRPGEVLLREDILDRRLINVAAGRPMNANDLALAQIDNQWRLVGVDPSPRGALRRLLPQRMRQKKRRPAPIVNWNDIQPFVGRVPTAKLLIPLQRLRRVDPPPTPRPGDSRSRADGL